MRGGKRPGAGRRKGALTKRTQEIAAQACANGVTPLDYMLKVMRDDAADEKRRDAMAIAAAPFVHPRLAAVEHSGDAENPVHTVGEIMVRIIDALDGGTSPLLSSSESIDNPSHHYREKVGCQRSIR